MARRPARSTCRSAFRAGGARGHSAPLRDLGSSPSAAPAPTRSRAAPTSRAPARRCTGRRVPGSARHGSARVNLFRGGGRSFGPVVRSHAIGLPKKVRALALKHALSAKAKDGGHHRPARRGGEGRQDQGAAAAFANLGLTNALIIDGAAVDANFAIAARNIPDIDVLPIQGINVYDILRRHTLVLTRAALTALEARFA